MGKGEHHNQHVQFCLCFYLPKKVNPIVSKSDNCCPLSEQEGKKPSQIISSQLNVGGLIKRNASNGNTHVLINSREITKEELWMLKVGVFDTAV